MQVLTRPWGAMHIRVDGPAHAPTVVFANSLGTDLRLWDAVLPLLPGIRALRFDKRGHGLSDLGLSDRGPTEGIEGFAEDAAALIENLAPGPVVFVGLSIGGMIGLQLAATRPELVRGLILSNAAARMGTADSWAARIAATRACGIDSIGDAVMERWFAPAFRATQLVRPWRNMLTRTNVEGYAAACAAIAAADLTNAATALRLPVLAIAGGEDGASPPAQVEATAQLIPGAGFHMIPGAGHLPCVETPANWTAIVGPFLKEHAR